jgi:hypothetical protein
MAGVFARAIWDQAQGIGEASTQDGRRHSGRERALWPMCQPDTIAPSYRVSLKAGGRTLSSLERSPFPGPAITPMLARFFCDRCGAHCPDLLPVFRVPME